eukprot:TRINITY_DN26925_c0_g1_i1.p3 TRINITY_DN26925_c0_g1~~TRINITY_DN26925_c0_g1_i1.p3  ORF type:complete len:138 (+),score=4.20 TRINITY_DN26925_c0_g1_i1:148-561(+)
MPQFLVALSQRLLRWNILSRECPPDSAIINIYEEGDCIPPHVDNHDFARPFCTISLCCSTPMVFGLKIRTVGDGNFKGSHAVILPPGSCMVLKGRGGDVTQHCIPSVQQFRISITLRPMGKEWAEQVREAKKTWYQN